MSNAACMRGAKIMITLKHAEKVTAVLFVAGLMQYGITTHAQDAKPACRPAQVIPLTGTEPAPRLIIEAPLAQPLASRGVVVIPYCARTCASHLCSARVLWQCRPELATFT
jgi:hypothetical protein